MKSGCLLRQRFERFIRNHFFPFHFELSRFIPMPRRQSGLSGCERFGFSDEDGPFISGQAGSKIVGFVRKAGSDNADEKSPFSRFQLHRSGVQSPFPGPPFDL